MIGTIYMQYSAYDDTSFNASDNYYGEGGYENALMSDFSRSKDVVYNSMSNAINGRGGLIQGGDGVLYAYARKGRESEEKMAFSPCEARLYNGSGEDETPDGLITSYVSMKPFVEMITFDISTSEEEFEQELTIWAKEHHSINKHKEQGGEEWAWSNEPIRDVYLSFKNKSNETVWAVLEGCKIMDIVGDDTIILYIEQMRLVDAFA